MKLKFIDYGRFLTLNFIFIWPLIMKSLLCCLLDGVPALCACFKNFVTRDEVTEPVCSALRNLTHQNEHANAAVRQVKPFCLTLPSRCIIP